MAEAVECHSGYTYGERPVAIHWEGERLEIEEILVRRRTPQGKYFRVWTKDKHTFDLMYDELADEWRIHQV